MDLSVTLVTPSDSCFPVALSGSAGRFDRLWASGDIGILSRRLVGIVCSARCPGEVILRTYDLVRALRDAGIPVVSGFHSPMERECRDILLRGKQPVVICPARSIERMRIPANWRSHILNGRLLLISPFGPQDKRPTTEFAERRNRLVAALAADLVVPYAAHGSKTEDLCRAVAGAGKRVWTLECSLNERLAAMNVKAVPVNELVTQVS